MRLFHVLVILALFFSAGCVAPINVSSQTNTSSLLGSPIIIETSTNVQASQGEPVIFCNTQTLEENEECFEDAFLACKKTIGEFWKTTDGYSLVFETKGIDSATENCLVRVTPGDSDSQFAGQSAECVIPLTPADDEHDQSYFDSYDIGMDTCNGSYTDAIVKSADEGAIVDTASPAPSIKTFSFRVDDDGVVGTKEFVVSKGDTVRLTIAVATSNVSFGGAWTRGPAGSKLQDESEYIFTTGNLSPGESTTVEFPADASFEFGIYWPGSNVLKGKGKVTVKN